MKSNHNLFPLQIWKQPHQIRCSDQFTGKKQDTDYFEHLHEENTKPFKSAIMEVELDEGGKHNKTTDGGN